MTLVLDNVRVGPFARVAVGSAVRENSTVPEGKIVGGVPARVIRNLTDEEKRQLVQSALNEAGYARSHVGQP
jgi:acetyltransferase-like isoleucine patch superfamily enzyme